MTKERKKRTALTKGGIATLILASSVLPAIVIAAETPQETENQTGMQENPNFSPNIVLKGKGVKRVIDLSTLYTYTGGEGFNKTDVVYGYDTSSMSGVKATLNGNFLTLESTSNVSVSGNISVSATLNSQTITKDVPVSITITTQLKDLAIGTSFTIGGMSWVLADPATGKLLSPKFTSNGNWFTASSSGSSTPIDQATAKILEKLTATEQKALVNSNYPTAFLQTLPKTKPTAAQMESMLKEEMKTTTTRKAYIASATDWYKYSVKYAYTKNIIGDVDTYKNYVLSNGHMAPYKDVGGFTYLYPGEVINNYGTGYVIAAMYINPDINILSGNKIDFANFSYSPAEKFKDFEAIQQDEYLGELSRSYNLKEYVNSSSYDVDRFTVSTSKLPTGVTFNYDTKTETVTLKATASDINETITVTVYDKSSKNNVVFEVPIKSGEGIKAPSEIMFEEKELGTISMTWEPIEGATRYRIKRNGNGGAWIYSGLSTSFDDKFDVQPKTEYTYTFEVTSPRGTATSTLTYLSKDVVVEEPPVEEPPTEEPPTEEPPVEEPTEPAKPVGKWTFDNPTGDTERLKRNVTLVGGKKVVDMVIEDIEYVSKETTVTTELGDIILKPDGKGNTLLTIPNGLGTSETSTKLKAEHEGVNFLDIKIQAVPKIEFNFKF